MARVVRVRLAEHAGAGWGVAHMVVVGVEHDEAAMVDVVSGCSMATIEAGGVLAGVHPPPVPCPCDVGGTGEVGVVLVTVAGEGDARRA